MAKTTLFRSPEKNLRELPLIGEDAALLVSPSLPPPRCLPTTASLRDVFLPPGGVCARTGLARHMDSPLGSSRQERAFTEEAPSLGGPALGLSLLRLTSGRQHFRRLAQAREQLSRPPLTRRDMGR